MRVAISRTALVQILAEVEAGGGREVCGLLLGEGSEIHEARPCANVADNSARRFEIDPTALIAAHRSARNGGPAVLGHYHSHPTGRPEPSPRDAADAAPDGSLWLIAAAGQVRGWRAVSDGAVLGRFEAVTLVNVAPCAADSGASEGGNLPEGRS